MRRELAVLCLSLVLAVAGCGGGSSGSVDGVSRRGETSSAPPSASPSTSASPLVGRYRTDPLTAEDLVAAATAAGYPEKRASALVAAQFRVPVVYELVITADTFVQRETVDGGTPQDGFRAAYSLTDDHTFVTTDDCGTTTFGFAVDDDRLRLDQLDSVISGCGPPDENLIVGTMVFESGVFTRESEDGGETSAADAAQTVDAFLRPFTIELADWLDPGSVDAATRFVTWQSADEQRAVRVLSPVSVYRPGASQESPPPADFPAYVLSLAEAGASITDRVDTEVDGHPAVEVTVGLPPGAGSLDGTLGCPEAGQAAEDCFGPQDELVLRLVAVDLDGMPLLVWERDYTDQADGVDYAPFDAMVASIHFS